MLPMIAALAIILAIFGAVAAPAWFDRDGPGFTDPALSADVLGLLCTLLVALQLVLAVVAMIAFRQKWNVEAERPRSEERRTDSRHRLRWWPAWPRWRNGRLGGLKNLCPYGRAGSNPALGI